MGMLRAIRKCFSPAAARQHAAGELRPIPNLAGTVARWGFLAFLMFAFLPISTHLAAQGRGRQVAAWGQRGPRGYGGQRMGGPGARRPEHLPQWFRQHQNLSLPAQQQALRNEPGFNRLPPLEQQRLFNRLQQLNAMPQARRERTLQRMEALEKLSPEQRQQVRNTMQQITQMPDDRRLMMHKAFRDLTQLPPEQRQAILNSPQFKSQFSDHEREMLNTLMSVQPYDPPRQSGADIQNGGK